MSEENGGQFARATVIDVPMRGQRDLATVTAEIRAYQDAARRMAISYSIEIGRRLIEAKEMVGHGEWGDYIKTELGFSQTTANNHMAMFRAYAADQMRLDGDNLKNQAFGNLTYTQALELLALPSEEEREAFVESHDMAGLSTRELREELRKRQQAQDGDDEGALLAEQFGTGAAPKEDNDEAEAEAELLREKLEAAQKDRQEAISQMDQAQMQGEEYRRRAIKAEEDLEFATKVKDALKAKSDEAEQRAQAAAEKMAVMEKQLREARTTENAAIKAEKAAVKALKEAKENPNIPPETLEKLRREAEEAARKALEAESGGKSLREAREQYAKAEQEASEARQEAARARQEAERLEKELRMAEPKVAVFRDRFASLQGDLSALIASIDELPADKQAGARKGLRAILQNALNMVQEPEEEGENHE